MTAAPCHLQKQMVVDYRGGDVAGKRVRWSPGLDDTLILYKEDKADKIFVLVTGGVDGTNTFQMCGWIVCSEGRQKRWWCASCQAYFVPQENLNDIRSLPR